MLNIKDIDIPEAVTIEKSIEIGVGYLADHIQSGAEIGPKLREFIVEVLRGEIKFKTGKKIDLGVMKTEANTEEKAVFEISRIMFFWDVTAAKAQRILLDYYFDLNDDTIRSYWKKHRRNRPKRVRTVSADGKIKVTVNLKSMPYLSRALLPSRFQFIGKTIDSDSRGMLANSDYPDGYQSIGFDALKF